MPPDEPPSTASTTLGRDELIVEDALGHTHRNAACVQVVTGGDDNAQQARAAVVSGDDAGGRVGGETGGAQGDEGGVRRAVAVACEGGDGLECDEEQLGGTAMSASRADVADGDGTVATPPNVPRSDGAPLECVILDKVESWDRVEVPKKFLYCTFVVEQGYRLFRIVIPRRVEGIFDQTKTLLSNFGLELEKLTEEAEEVPLDVFPLYNAEEFGSEQRCLSDESVFIKRPKLTSWKPGFENRVSEPMKSEMRTFQQLAKSPHKNIVDYKGCVVRNGRVIAFCLGKLKCTLYDAVQFNKELWLQLDKNRVMSGLRSAVAHLHKLGLCHNDIGPANVMLDSDNEAVLIDMDSSKPVGEKLCKGGTYQWAEYEDLVSAKRNDTDALAKLEAFFRKGPLK